MLHELERLLEAAIKAFRDNHAQAEIDINEIADEAKIGPGAIVDKIIRLTMGEKQIQYNVEIKRNLQRPYVGLIIHRRNHIPGPFLLVTNYVNEAIAEDLRKNKIEFIDAAGNAYIDQPPLFIHIKGNKLKDKWLGAMRDQAFRGTGLKVVFIFLGNPQMVNKNYRAIARAAGVALGNIGMIIDDLTKQGFLLDMGKKGYKLVNKRRLLDRFVGDYPKRLRQRLLMGRFQGILDWREMDALGFENALWGGEVAAAEMTDYLKPQNLTIYLEPKLFEKFLIKHRLKKDPNGEIEILELFWGLDNLAGNKGLVHPILVYTDLIATANNRNIETAQVIYERYIAELIRED